MTEDPIDQLVVRASAGDEAGWQALWAAIELPLTRIIGNRRFLGHLGTREDDRRSIIVAVMGRLRAENFQRPLWHATAEISTADRARVRRHVPWRIVDGRVQLVRARMRGTVTRDGAAREHDDRHLQSPAAR